MDCGDIARALCASRMNRHLQPIGVDIPALQSIADTLFAPLTSIINTVPWQVMLRIPEKSIPSYLESLLKITQQLLLGEDTSATISRMGKAFFAGMSQFWDFIVSLLNWSGLVISARIKQLGGHFAEFQSLVQQYGSLAYTALRYILNAAKYLLEKVVSLFTEVAHHISDFAGSFAVSVFHTNATAVQKQATSAILFAFLGMQDIMEMHDRVPAAIGKMHVSKFSADIATYITTLKGAFEKYASVSGITNAIMQLPFIQSIIQYVSDTRPMKLLKFVLDFVINIVQRVQQTAATYLAGFMARCTRKLAEIIDRVSSLIPMPPMQSFSKLGEAARELAQHPAVSDSKKKDLNQAIAYYTRFLTYLEDFTDAKYANNALIDIFKSTKVTSNLLTELFFSEKVEDIGDDALDTLTQNRCGLTFDEFTQQLTDHKALLTVRFYAATLDLPRKKREKIESAFKSAEAELKPIGVDPHSNTSFTKETSQFNEEIQDLQDQIDTLDADILDIQSSPQYKDLRAAIDRTLMDFFTQVPAVENMPATTSAYKKLIDEQIQTLEATQGITGKKLQIEALQLEIRNIRAEKEQKRSKVETIRKWAIVIVIGAAFVGTVWYASRVALRSGRLAAQTLFNGVVRASDEDPILHHYIEKFAASGTLERTEVSTDALQKLQKFISDEITDLSTVPFSTIEKTWAPLLSSSINRQMYLAKERKKAPADSVAKKVLLQMSAFYKSFTGETSPSDVSTTTTDGETAPPPIQLRAAGVVGEIGMIMMRDIDISKYIGGVKYYNGNTRAEKEETFREHTQLMLRSHQGALENVFTEEFAKIRLAQDEKDGLFNAVYGFFSNNIKQTGIGGADASASVSPSEYIDALTRGGVPYIVLLVGQFQTWVTMGLIFAEGVICSLVQLINIISYTFCHEETKSYDAANEFKNIIRKMLTAGAFTLITATTSQFYGRFCFIIQAGRIIVEWFLLGPVKGWVSGIFSCCCGKCRTKKDTETAVAGDDRKALKNARRSQTVLDGKSRIKTESHLALVMCAVCAVSSANWKCEACSKPYCSHACQALTM